MEQRQFKLAMGAWVVFHLITTWNTWLYISSNSFFAAGAPLGRNHPWTDYLMLSCYLVAVVSVDVLLFRGRRHSAARKKPAKQSASSSRPPAGQAAPDSCLA